MDIHYYIHVLHGRNSWAECSVIEAVVDLNELIHFTPKALLDLQARLTAWLPEWTEYSKNVCGQHDHASLVQLLKNLCLALHTLIGYDIHFSCVKESTKKGIYKIVIAFQDEQVSITCLKTAIELLQAATHDLSHDISSVLQKLKADVARTGLSLSERALVAAAKRRHIPCSRIDQSSLLYFGYGKKQKHSWGALPTGTGAIAYGIVDDRVLLSQLLKAAGIPVAINFLLDQFEDVWSAAEELGLPVVIKRRYATYAKGAQLNLQSQAEVESAYVLTKEDEYSVLMEQFIQGNTYHLLIMHGQLVAASFEHNTSIVDVKALVHSENIHYAALTAKVVGLKIAHIIIVAEDIAHSLRMQRGKIIGVNPMLNLLHWQSVNNQNPAAQALIADFFPEDHEAAGCIPIFSVIGLMGQNLAARLLQHMFLQQKYDVGLACQQGIFLNRRLIDAHRSDHAQAARQLLLNPWVDHAILENSWQGIESGGLGFEVCAYGLITDLAEEHLPKSALQREQVFKNMCCVLDAVMKSGVAILPAEDHLLEIFAKACRGTICYFSILSDNPLLQAHINKGGSAVYLKNNLIILAQGQDKIAALSAEILLKLTQVAQKSLLAAVSAAWLSGMRAEEIQQALNSFRDWFIPEVLALGNVDI